MPKGYTDVPPQYSVLLLSPLLTFCCSTYCLLPLPPSILLPSNFSPFHVIFLFLLYFTFPSLHFLPSGCWTIAHSPLTFLWEAVRQVGWHQVYMVLACSHNSINGQLEWVNMAAGLLGSQQLQQQSSLFFFLSPPPPTACPVWQGGGRALTGSSLVSRGVV